MRFSYMADLIDLQHNCVNGRIVQPEFVTAEFAYLERASAMKSNGAKRGAPQRKWPGVELKLTHKKPNS